MTPFFSIIMPVYNREGLVGRALASCFMQEDGDFEIVVVDDGSTDDTVAVIERVTDPRLRLIRHDRNQGRCPARNTGMAEAHGEWFVFLDSDDELLPGALAAMRQRASELPEDVGGMRFMCIDPSGPSPDPPHRDEIWDYEGYMRWLETAIHGKVEALPCSRRSTFPAVRFGDRHATEGSYHLDLTRAHRVLAASDVVRRYHHDAANRITVADPERTIRYAPDDADNLDAVLRVHGPAMRRWAPTMYRVLVNTAAFANFVAGRRGAGWLHARTAIALRPLSPRAWVIALVGTVSGSALARLQAAFGDAKRRLTGPKPATPPQ